MSAKLKSNNFDILRLGLALIVCLVHAADLSQFPALVPIALFLSSDLAVKSFFVVSGFLIFMSYEKSPDLKTYLVRRGRRIYPAYFAIVLACALMLFFTSSKTAAEYFSGTWVRYVVANLVFLNTLQPTLPGVFENNYMHAVNGALWTLKVEVMFYLTVPFLAHTFRRFGWARGLATVYAASLAYSFVMHSLAASTGNPIYTELAKQLPGQLSYFMAGAAIYYYFPLFEKHIRTIVPCAIAAYMASKFFSIGVITPAALACVVLAIVFFIPPIRLFKGDYSYGVYIVHFPLIQMLLHNGTLADRPLLFLLTCVVMAAAGAFVMWELVESRFIRLVQPAKVDRHQGHAGA
jgi:peptidoglycan/LPS O-acetylase OafA/YrhL